MATVENAILGAGPYGLSVAAHMRATNTDFRIVGLPMESWRMNMPPGMMLKSEPFASSLSDPGCRYSLKNFCVANASLYRPKHTPIHLSNFTEYADWFQRLAVPELTRAKAIYLRKLRNGFEITLDNGEVFAARRVILATGHMAFRQIPSALQRFAGSLVSHSSDYGCLSKFAGQDVTVVGCGQSALETAALLHENRANVRVLARAAAVDWNRHPRDDISIMERLLHPDAALGRGRRSLLYSELPRMFFYLPLRSRQRIVATVNGPSGAWWLKDRLIDKVPIWSGHEITDAVPHGDKLQLTVLTNEKSVEISTDHVIAATGYKVEVDRLTFIEPALRSNIKVTNGFPILTTSFESSIRGLYFIGLASALSFGPIMRFIYGSKHAAKMLNAHVRSAAIRRPRELAWIGHGPYEPTVGSGVYPPS
jgi:thioredoxin reductase